MINKYKKNAAAVSLGSVRTKGKAEASRRNGLDQRPHVKKLKHFVSKFPHALKCNEYGICWPVKLKTASGKRNQTYNPDYWCEVLNCFIEVATSKPNISEQRIKWSLALADGRPLKIFWWEGNEITDQFK